MATFYLEGAVGKLKDFDGFGEQKTFVTIHLKYVLLNGPEFGKALLELNRDAVGTIILDNVDFIGGDIPRTCFPNLKSFTFNEYQYSTYTSRSKYYESIKPILFFNKVEGVEWDWVDLWGLGVDIVKGVTSDTINLNHGKKEFEWGFTHFYEVLSGAKDEIEKLIFPYDSKENLDLAEAAFPKNLKYFEFKRGSTQEQWNVLEDLIFQNKNLKEAKLKLKSNVSTYISKLPKSLEILKLTGHSRELNIREGFDKLDNLKELSFDFNISDFTKKNISKYFDCVEFSYFSSMPFGHDEGRLSPEMLESILQMKRIQFIYTDSFSFSDFEKSSSDLPLARSALANVDFSKYSNKGLVLERSSVNSEWFGRRLFHLEEEFKRCQICWGNIEFFKGRCEIGICGQNSQGVYELKEKFPKDRRCDVNPVILHSIELENCDKVETFTCFATVIDQKVLFQILKNFENLKTFHMPISVSKIVEEDYPVKCHKDFEPRIFVPFDLEWISETNIKSLIIHQRTFTKTSKALLVLDNLVLNGCILERSIFDSFDLHFAVKQIAFSAVSDHHYMKYLPSSTAHYEKKKEILSMAFGQRTTLGINHELLHFILKSSKAETIIVTDFDHGFSSEFKDEISKFLKDSGLGGWEKCFILQKQNVWKGKALDPAIDFKEDGILYKAFYKGESIPMLKFEEDNEFCFDSEAQAKCMIPNTDLEEIDFVLHGQKYKISDITLNQSKIHDRGGCRNCKQHRGHIRTRFTGFSDPKPATVLSLENLVLNGEIFSAALENLDKSNIEEIVIKNASIEGSIAKMEFPKLKKFILEKEIDRSNPNASITVDQIINSFVFFGKNQPLSELFRKHIFIKNESQFKLEIDPQEKKILIHRISKVNEILKNSDFETVEILMLSDIFRIDFDIDLISDQNVINNLSLADVDLTWEQVETILQRTKHLVKFFYTPHCSRRNHVITYQHFPKTLKYLELNQVNLNDSIPPEKPLKLYRVVLRSIELLDFQRHFNPIQIFILYTHPKWKQILPLLNLERSELILVDRFQADADKSELSIGFEISEWGDFLLLRKQNKMPGAWKYVHFYDSSRFRNYDLDYNSNIQKALDEIDLGLPQAKIFDGFPQGKVLKSINLSSIVLDGKIFSQGLKQSVSNLVSISLENVKVIKKFTPVYLPNLKFFKLHLHPIGELYKLLLDWSNLKSFLFFQNGKFEKLWDLGIGISVTVGNSRILQIDHSNSIFISRIKDSNGILCRLPHLDVLGLHSQICNPILPSGLKILRLDGVDMKWCDLESALASNDSLAELKFMGRGYSSQQTTITLKKLPQSLKILSLSLVTVEFDPEYQKLNLDVLELENCLSSGWGRLFQENFQKYFNAKTVNIFVGPGGGDFYPNLLFIYNLIHTDQTNNLYASMIPLDRIRCRGGHGALMSLTQVVEKSLTDSVHPDDLLRSAFPHKCIATSEDDLISEEIYSFLRSLGFIFEEPEVKNGNRSNRDTKIYDFNIKRDENGQWTRVWVDNHNYQEYPSKITSSQLFDLQ